jgi:hypothetical protein
LVEMARIPRTGVSMTPLVRKIDRMAHYAMPIIQVGLAVYFFVDMKPWWFGVMWGVLLLAAAWLGWADVHYRKRKE